MVVVLFLQFAPHPVGVTVAVSVAVSVADAASVVAMNSIFEAYLKRLLLSLLFSPLSPSTRNHFRYY